MSERHNVPWVEAMLVIDGAALDRMDFVVLPRVGEIVILPNLERLEVIQVVHREYPICPSVHAKRI